MKELYSPTWISDNFPLRELECQYFQVCKFYNPKKCSFTSKCDNRTFLRNVLEKYVARDTLHLEIMEIIHGENETKK